MKVRRPKTRRAPPAGSVAFIQAIVAPKGDTPGKGHTQERYGSLPGRAGSPSEPAKEGTDMVDDIGKMHFRRMDEGTDADFAVLARVHQEEIRKLPDRLMGILTGLKGDEAYPVDRLQHSLQAATRALRDGRDEEYVVCALLHDIGESLGPFNHGEVVEERADHVFLVAPVAEGAR